MFATTINFWASSSFDPAIGLRHGDVVSEYALRKTEPPYELTKSETDAVVKAVSAWVKTLPAERLEE